MDNAVDFIKEITLKKVKERGKNFAGEYANFGLWSNPFTASDRPLESNFDHLFVPNKKQIESITNSIINAMTGKGQDIAVIAPIGAGARTLVDFIKYFLRSLESEEHELQLQMLRDKLDRIIDVDVCNLAPTVRDQIRKDVTEALKRSKMMIVTSHFCDKHLALRDLNNKFNEPTLDTYRKVLELDSLSADKVIFLSPWSAIGWDYTTSESPMLKEVYELPILLDPYSKEEVVEMLARRVDFFKLEDASSPFGNKEFLSVICDFAGNIPRFCLEFAAFVLEEMCEKDYKPTKENVIKILKMKDAYELIKQNLHELIPPPKSWHKKENTVKTILKIMIQLGGENITATEISQYIDKSRPAISRNLYDLENKKIIQKSESSKKDERKVPYNVPDFVRSIFEKEFIIPDIQKEIRE